MWFVLLKTNFNRFTFPSSFSVVFVYILYVYKSVFVGWCDSASVCWNMST